MRAVPTEEDPALRRLIDQILTARASGSPLDIRGGGTKSFYGGSLRGDPLDLRALCGISSLEPTELVVTARAGTLLCDLEAALAEVGQCLPFEPPRFGVTDAAGPHAGTVGGMVAAGLAGPSRASAGGVRDHVLGVALLNGRAELLRFGGQVMKNVAGYDVSRLMVGSLGVLGVLCEVSFKVLPLPSATTTLAFDVDQASALERLAALRSRPLPVTASSWSDGCLRIRLGGARAAVDHAARTLGGVVVDADAASGWWRGLRDQAGPFWTADSAGAGSATRLWRLSLPPTAPVLDLPGPVIVEWGGQQRWCRSSGAMANVVRDAAARAGGHATLFRRVDGVDCPFADVSGPVMQLHHELKHAFDPDRLFNPGRLHPDL